MGAGHDHSHVPLGAGARHRGRLVVVAALTGGFFIVEVVTATLTNSLAMLSDAGHMLTDLLGLGMALAAITLAARHGVHHGEHHDEVGDEGSQSRPRSRTSGHTYGLYRLEIIAAFCNALLLFAVAGYVLIEAIRRIGATPDILGGPMLVVAILGLVVNVVAYFVLRAGAAARSDDKRSSAARACACKPSP